MFFLLIEKNTEFNEYKVDQNFMDFNFFERFKNFDVKNDI